MLPCIRILNDTIAAFCYVEYFLDKFSFVVFVLYNILDIEIYITFYCM